MDGLKAAPAKIEEPSEAAPTLEEAKRFLDFLCARECPQCAKGKPLLVNSSGFYSHREDGNYCNNHRLLKAWEDFNAAFLARVEKKG